MPRPERSEFDRESKSLGGFLLGPRSAHHHDERLLGIDKWAEKDQHNARDAFRHAYSMCRATMPFPLAIQEIVLGVAVTTEDNDLRRLRSQLANAVSIHLMDVVNYFYGFQNGGQASSPSDCACLALTDLINGRLVVINAEDGAWKQKAEELRAKLCRSNPGQWSDPKDPDHRSSKGSRDAGGPDIGSPLEFDQPDPSPNEPEKTDHGDSVPIDHDPAEQPPLDNGYPA